MNTSKPRLIKDFKKLDKSLQQQIKLAYPLGFSDNLITFTNREGKLVSALPYETEDYFYMVKMSQDEAVTIVEKDDDYNDDGILREEIKDKYEEKYGDLYDLSDDDFIEDIV